MEGAKKGPESHCVLEVLCACVRLAGSGDVVDHQQNAAQGERHEQGEGHDTQPEGSLRLQRPGRDPNRVQVEEEIAAHPMGERVFFRAHARVHPTPQVGREGGHVGPECRQEPLHASSPRGRRTGVGPAPSSVSPTSAHNRPSRSSQSLYQGRGRRAGPETTSPRGPYSAPWQGHTNPSAVLRTMQPRCVQRQENAPVPSSFRRTNRSRSCSHVSVFILKSDGRPRGNRRGNPSSKSGTATRTPPTTADRAQTPATVWPARARKSRRDVASSRGGRRSGGSCLSVLGSGVSIFPSRIAD